MTSDLARRVRVQRRWGLEVGILGEAFDHAGFRRSAQVDLGRYEHDHRAVSGPTGLTEMSDGVADALFRAVGDAGLEVDYDTVREDFQQVADDLVRAYGADAAFNDYQYDPEAERDQAATYAEAITPPGEDTRLPAWRDAPIDPAAVRQATRPDP